MMLMAISRGGERRLWRYRMTSLPFMIHPYPKSAMVTNEKGERSGQHRAWKRESKDMLWNLYPAGRPRLPCSYGNQRTESIKNGKEDQNGLIPEVRSV
jgi:hypothetical protein